MDSAMMRRIPYNFFIVPPTPGEYIEIFRRNCATVGLPFNLQAVETVMKRISEVEKLPLARSQPRFIVEHVLARCNYEGRDPSLDEDLAIEAAEHLFTKQ